MNDFIKECKKEVVDYLINMYISQGKYTDEEIVTVRKNLEAYITKAEILSNKVNEVNQTNSSVVNIASENLYYDLFTTFKANDKLYALIDEYMTLSLMSIKNTNIKFDMCINKLNDFGEVLKTKGNPKIMTEEFINNTSIETNSSIYTERYGEYIKKVNHVHYDVVNKRLTLPILAKTNTCMYDNGVSTSSLKIRKQLGKNFININTSNSIDNIVDTSKKSFWKKTVLSDSPINVDFSNEKPSIPTELKDFYYGLKHGCLLEFELIYEAVTTINCIEVTPCTKYPMELVAIRYSSTDDINEDLEELVYPKNTREYLRNEILDDSVIYNFQDITCKRIYFIFNQINYEKKNFILNTTDNIKNEVWLDTVEDTKDLSIYGNEDLIFKPNYLDRKINSDYLNVLNKFAINPKSIDFYKSFYENAKTYKNIVKNAYEFGFYNISTYYLDYANTGVYVSDWIDVQNNIESISIITNELHMPSSDETVDTDIEYYISYNTNPTYNDWYSILPKNKKFIHSELLQLGTDECILRFPVKKLYSVYMNEILLVEGEDYIVHADELGITSIEIPGYNHRAIYKASYEPLSDATVLSISNSNDLYEAATNTDVILGNGTNLYELTNAPFTDLENKTFVKIVNIETGEVVFQENINVFCVTDPANNSESYKLFFDGADMTYQYYTYNNKIFFNNPVPSNFKIEVTYKFFASKFRIKAIMRRNNHKDTWLSPILNSIEYSVTII